MFVEQDDGRSPFLDLYTTQNGSDGAMIRAYGRAPSAASPERRGFRFRPHMTPATPPVSWEQQRTLLAWAYASDVGEQCAR